MNWLYDTAIRIYGLAVRCVASRNPKAAKMIAGHRESLDRLRRKIKPGDRPVWIHVASLGEFEQGRPLIERIRREHPGKKIVLSFFSPSGFEVRRNYDKVDATFYLPFDTPGNARRIIDAIDPSVAIFVKYEFWGNYLETLYKRDIPVYLISAIFRRNQIFFRPYGGFMRRVLGFFKHLYIQDENSRRLLSSVGISNVTVAGDTRFDRVTDVMKASSEIAGMDRFNAGNGADLIFGSSWPADEEKYFKFLNDNPDLTFIIAPHEFDDERLKKMRDSLRGNVVLLSQWEKMAAGESTRATGHDKIRGIIVDSFGKLSSLYRYARVAYIGGGFGSGIHNINEAAVYGIPVVFGPVFRKFKEASDLIAAGGAFSCRDASEVCDTLRQLTYDEKMRSEAGKEAGDYIRRSIGATDLIYRDLF